MRCTQTEGPTARRARGSVQSETDERPRAAVDAQVEDAVPSVAAAGEASAERDAQADAAEIGTRDAAGPSAFIDAGATPANTCTPTAPGLLVAFIGDQGNGVDADAVLRLIKSEGADAVLHNGDFDYADDPQAWEARIDGILGPDFPYLATVGNHDAQAWAGEHGYQARIAARAARTPAVHCRGEIGASSICEIQGLRIVQSCVGVNELDPVRCGADAPSQIAFLNRALSTRTHVWNICSWHKNQHDMQVGTKSDEVGYAAYRACMDFGAIIATGHEHSYARTTTLTDVGNVRNGHGAYSKRDLVEASPGKTFVFVSGVGGYSVRPFDPSHDTDTWWGAFATSDRWFAQGIEHKTPGNFGALFIRFYVDGDPHKASGYFKDVSGRVLDEFTIFTQ